MLKVFSRINFVPFIVILFTIIETTNAVLKIDMYQQYPAKLTKLKKYASLAPIMNESVVLYKFMDSEYYGKINIGHPAKEFKVVFDTTWGDTWLPSERCSYSEIACRIHTRYDSAKSSTYQEDGTPVNITTNTFSLLGFLSRDDFHLPHKKVENQTFVEMTHMSLKSFIATRADGIIGLGFTRLSQNNTIPFFYNMVKQGIISEDVFTIYMNRDETTEKAGRLIFGGTERKHVRGKLTFVPVIDKAYWKVQLNRVTVESGTKTFFITENVTTIMDSSTNVIRGPRQFIQKINTLLNAKDIAPEFGRYMVKCREYATLPHVNFMIGDSNFTIESKYYVQRMNFGSMEICFSPFMPSDFDFWELGGAFLMQFYTEFYFDGRLAIGETLF